MIVAAITGALIAWQAWETRKSAAISAVSAKAALLNAEAIISAERAWLLAELDWLDVLPKNYLSGTYSEGGKEIVYSTDLRVKLVCRNEGRSPAWVDSIHVHMEILTDIRQANKNKPYPGSGKMDPIGSRERTLYHSGLERRWCDGRP